MQDDDFPSDSASPKPLQATIATPKGTTWYKPRPKALRETRTPDAKPVLSPKTTAVHETPRETEKRLRIEARAKHRKYRGPNPFSEFVRRAPESKPSFVEMKPATQVAAQNLVRMLTIKGQRKVVN